MSPAAPEAAWDSRFANARVVVAEWINACRELNRRAFARATFDIWIGQECGQELGNTMQVTIATRDGLPDLPLLELLRKHPAAAVRFWDWGHQPLELGAFPELRIADGALLHSWGLDVAFLDLASERFRRWHKLDPAVADPYRQLSRGESEPGPFEWSTVSDEAVERERGVFIMEAITDSDRKKGFRITAPEDVVAIADAYDLEAQLVLADVDITAACFEPFQRLQHARYLRPALRHYCERMNRAVPPWLADDSAYEKLTEKERLRLFGQPSLGIRKFQPLRPVKGMTVVMRDEE